MFQETPQAPCPALAAVVSIPPLSNGFLIRNTAKNSILAFFIGVFALFIACVQPTDGDEKTLL
jgi:hypothetical protein